MILRCHESFGDCEKKTFCESADYDTRDLDESHGFAGGCFGFVVEDEAAGLYEPAEDAFDHPASELCSEAFRGGRDLIV